jgi:hypothetical protein
MMHLAGAAVLTPTRPATALEPAAAQPHLNAPQPRASRLAIPSTPPPQPPPQQPVSYQSPAPIIPPSLLLGRTLPPLLPAPQPLPYHFPSLLPGAAGAVQSSPGLALPQFTALPFLQSIPSPALPENANTELPPASSDSAMAPTPASTSASAEPIPALAGAGGALPATVTDVSASLAIQAGSHPSFAGSLPQPTPTQQRTTTTTSIQESGDHSKGLPDSTSTSLLQFTPAPLVLGRSELLTPPYALPPPVVSKLVLSARDPLHVRLAVVWNLKQAGALTDAEFAEAKQKILHAGTFPLHPTTRSYASRLQSSPHLFVG